MDWFLYDRDFRHERVNKYIDMTFFCRYLSMVIDICLTVLVLQLSLTTGIELSH